MVYIQGENEKKNVCPLWNKVWHLDKMEHFQDQRNCLDVISNKSNQSYKTTDYEI